MEGEEGDGGDGGLVETSYVQTGSYIREDKVFMPELDGLEGVIVNVSSPSFRLSFLLPPRGWLCRGTTR